MSDENIYFEILSTLERISDNINREVFQLKKRLKISNLNRELRSPTNKFMINIILPLFKSKENILIEDILQVTLRKKSTVMSYLSELCKMGYLKRERNLKGDKRKKIYQLSNN